MSDETFNASVLPMLSPFSIDFDNTTSTERTSAKGYPYQEYTASILSRGKKFYVRMFKKDFDALRVLHMLGYESFNATEGMAPAEGGYPPIHFSPAKQ